MKNLCIREIVVFSWSTIFDIYTQLNCFVYSLFLKKKKIFVGIFETWQTKKHQNGVTQGLPDFQQEKRSKLKRNRLINLMKNSEEKRFSDGYSQK